LDELRLQMEKFDINLLKPTKCGFLYLYYVVMFYWCSAFMFRNLLFSYDKFMLIYITHGPKSVINSAVYEFWDFKLKRKILLKKKYVHVSV
jgi:hypothetical protein